MRIEKLHPELLKEAGGNLDLFVKKYQRVMDNSSDLSPTEMEKLSFLIQDFNLQHFSNSLPLGNEQDIVKAFIKPYKEASLEGLAETLLADSVFLNAASTVSSFLNKGEESRIYKLASDFCEQPTD